MSYQNLRAEMKRYNITQADLASLLDVRIATVSSWMQGQESGFPILKAKAIRDRFFPNSALDYLFTEDLEPALSVVHTDSSLSLDKEHTNLPVSDLEG